METIIVKPKNAQEAQDVIAFLAERDIETEVYPARTKKEILDGIEQGAKEAVEFIQGKRKLRSVKDFLNEL